MFQLLSSWQNKLEKNELCGRRTGTHCCFYLLHAFYLFKQMHAITQEKKVSSCGPKQAWRKKSWKFYAFRNRLDISKDFFSGFPKYKLNYLYSRECFKFDEFHFHIPVAKWQEVERTAPHTTWMAGAEHGWLLQMKKGEAAKPSTTTLP